MWEIAIRCEGGEVLILTLLGRSHPGAADYWDGNWIRAAVEVRAGGFRGDAVGDIRADELTDFHSELARLQEVLRGTAEFRTMEGWLSIRVTGDGRGHLTFRCRIQDYPGTGNVLDCTLGTDQTFTRDTVRQLSAAVQAFPVVGRPN